jgi:NADPH2:quinone reductase
VKAILVSRFGGPEVLELADRPDPVPGPGQVAIDVTHLRRAGRPRGRIVLTP